MSQINKIEEYTLIEINNDKCFISDVFNSNPIHASFTVYNLTSESYPSKRYYSRDLATIIFRKIKLEDLSKQENIALEKILDNYRELFEKVITKETLLKIKLSLLL